MNKLSIALDWTPNTNHIGIFVAQANGYYSEEDIEINILNPLDDEYQITPGKKLETGQAQLAIAPFETVISLNNKVNAVDAVAVYAILQEDISSIVTLESSGLNRPSLLDKQLYASYKARYEDAIVKAMVRQDGGTGAVDMIYPDKLGIWNTLLQNKAEATWIFNNWEGIEAATKQVALNQFTLKDYGIPYGYSPVIIAKKQALQQDHDIYRAFIAATKKGYAFAVEQPAAAAQLLFPHLTPADQRNIDLMASIIYTIPYFGDASSMGWMEETRVHDFLRWLVQQNIEQPAILLQQLYTNELLGNRS